MSGEDSEQHTWQWNFERLILPHPPCFYTKQCICLREIGPHSFYVTKCCNQPMHQKCFFNLIEEALTGNAIGTHCPFCRSDKFVDKQCGRDYLTTKGFPIPEGKDAGTVVIQLMILRIMVDKRGRNGAMHMAAKLFEDDVGNRNVAMHAFRTFGWGSVNSDGSETVRFRMAHRGPDRLAAELLRHCLSLSLAVH